MDTARLIKILSTQIFVRPSHDCYNGSHWRVSVVSLAGTTIYEEVSRTRDAAVTRAHDFKQALGGRSPITIR